MATKKQKREAMQAKRQAFEKEHLSSGLEAQRKDRMRREAQAKRNQEEAKKINRRHNKILDSAKLRGDLPSEDVGIDLTRKAGA